jgi:hypothetical protein
VVSATPGNKQESLMVKFVVHSQFLGKVALQAGDLSHELSAFGVPLSTYRTASSESVLDDV